MASLAVFEILDSRRWSHEFDLSGSRYVINHHGPFLIGGPLKPGLYL